MLKDMPKIECPFIRKTYKVLSGYSKKNNYSLRSPSVYLVTPEINPGYEWVFEDSDTFCVEKLDGSNVSIRTENGRLVEVQNRKNPIDPLRLLKGNGHYVESIMNSVAKGYVSDNTIEFGEAIGPKFQSNPYNLSHHLWYPFSKAISDLRYKIFDNQERSFDNWSSLLKEALKSRFYMKVNKCSFNDSAFAEGVVFYNLKRRDNNQVYMAKLRRDMFRWYYGNLIIEETSISQ